MQLEMKIQVSYNKKKLDRVTHMAVYLFLLCDTVNVAYVMYAFNKPPWANASVFYAGQGALPNLKKGVFSLLENGESE